jgi:hypothetical protein
LGHSIETLTPINDYVRYPSKIDVVKRNLDRWIDHAKNKNWLVQLRITPTCLTIHDLLTVYDYAWQHNLSIESCNFLIDPEIMRISVLPVETRQSIAEKFKAWLETHEVSDNRGEIINTRDPNISRTQIVQDVNSYINFLQNEQDDSFRLPDLVQYLKLLDKNRKNSVLDYLPQYENLFRNSGY